MRKDALAGQDLTFVVGAGMATILRGLALALRYNVSVADHWREAAVASVAAGGHISTT
jgi:hypothetical protein